MEALFACIGDKDSSDIRLPWLDIVLVCFDGVGLKRVSWAVRYLDKPQWRAVSPLVFNKHKLYFDGSDTFFHVFYLTKNPLFWV